MVHKRVIPLLILGVTVFLAAFGVAFAVSNHPTWQVWQKKDGSATLNPLRALSSGDIVVSFDSTGDQQVVSLQFPTWHSTPPVRSWRRSAPQTVWFHNDTDTGVGPAVNLRPVDPCHEVLRKGTNETIGKIEADIWLNGKWIGTTCWDDWKPQEVIPPGAMAKMEVRLHPHGNLVSGDMFDVVFAAVGVAGEMPAPKPVPGDVNGDGVPDFIVGAYQDDPVGGGTDAGSAYVFSGADGSLLYQVTGDNPGDLFGISGIMAGDVNGDGRADFMVGAPFDDPAGGGTDAGSAYVFSGADGSLLYQRTGDTAGDFFGWSVSGAGDVNGDGKADFIVGAYLDDPAGGGTDAGSAYVFSGADGSLLYHVTGDTAGDQFGISVSGAGDVNGDGVPEFIVGARRDDPAGGEPNAGSAYVFSGSDGSLLYQVTGDTIFGEFGSSVSGAGDVNEDGKADFIVGAFQDDPPGGGTNAGSAYVFSGADGSLLYRVTGDTANDNFGFAVSGAGDVNEDGKADFIVGAYLDDPAGGGTDSGSAYVFSGSDGSLLYQRTGDTVGDRFGISVSGAGDANGDGRADFIVGADYDDPVGGGNDAGSAYVFSGADGSFLYQVTGDTANDLFGFSVGGAK